jgi:hypothetical protein
MEFLHLESIPFSFLGCISRMLKQQENVLTIAGLHRGSSMVSLTRGVVATSHRKASILSRFNIFDTHGSVHRRLLSKNTNKMQLCNRIYYSKVFYSFSTFRAAYRSSSEALNRICSLWFICLYGDQLLPRLQIQFRAPDDERCAARNMLSL